MRKLFVVLGLVVLLFFCAAILGPDGLDNLGRNLAYVVVGCIVAWFLLFLANRLHITGEHFDLGDWLDIIVGQKPSPYLPGADGRECSRVAMAIVILGILLSIAVVVSRFVG